MMDERPDLRGRSHGGAEVNSQVRRQALNASANSLLSPKAGTENEPIESFLVQKKSCRSRGLSGKGSFNPMSFRSFSYWFICSIAAVIAVGAAEPDMASTLSFSLSEAGNASVLPVPEPSRALLLFAGIMAMAFTYRRAWLSWKRGAQA